MRYFYLIFILTVATLSGCSVSAANSRKPPLEIFPDMVRQWKIRPQTPSDFYQDGRSSRPYPEGAVARSKPLTFAGEEIKVDGKPVYALSRFASDHRHQRHHKAKRRIIWNCPRFR